MNSSIATKIVLTGLVLLFAITSLLPVQDTDFGIYIREEVSAEEDAFANILTEAEQRMAADPEAAPTLYTALKQMSEETDLDLQTYFPHINATDIKNRIKRNDTLLNELLKRSHGKLRLGLDLKGGVSFTFSIAEDDLSSNTLEREDQIAQAMEVITQRVDGMGVAESVVRLKGDNQIEVQMPGINTRDNPELIEDIGAPAQLSFHLVHRTASPRTQPEPPLGYIEKVLEREDRETGEILRTPIYIKRIPEMDGSIIAEAYAVQNEFGGFRVILNLTDEGDDLFASVTRRIAEENNRTNSLGQMAIVLDGYLYSAPSVRQEISGGTAEITGQFSQREAVELANVLNNPLEVGLQLEELYEISPTLAADAQEASKMAATVGALLVAFFMLFYYRMAGAVAMSTVALNVLIVMGLLASFGAVLSLPGVAALVLTVGMAVDANILIFERIREEIGAGKSLHASVLAGFDKAFSTIVDANVTTFITAFILYWLGSGPVQGFGVTLMVGILATVFCALIVSRWMLELLVNLNIMKRFPRMQILGEHETPFLNYARKAFIGSWCVVLLGVVAVYFHRDVIMGIDFTGGDEIIVSYEQPITGADIDQVAAEAMFAGENNALIPFGEVNTQFQTLVGQGQSVIKIQTEAGKGSHFYNALVSFYPEAGLELIGETKIGPAVGESVTRSALISIGVALVFILLYIAIRFEFGYGAGAIVATIHDVVMTIGLFVALGEFFGMGSGQFTSPMIAAILMTVGYSINDTIVVFDRIREELEINPGMNLRRVVHLSINRVLSRTILTSATTLFASAALYFLGAGVVVDFALVFMIGILTGTFSSIFIASPVFFWYHKGDRRKVEERHILPTYDWTTETATETPAKAPAK